jgi:hypothetical protein
MPRGASNKREEEYERLKEEFHESGRYKGREEEVAARIVNKQRAEFAETKGAKEEDRKGRSSDRNLPMEGYDHLTIDQVAKKLNSLTRQEVQRVKSYELKHKNRKTLIEQLDKRL